VILENGKREEGIENWRKLHDKELWVIKAMSSRWAGHVARMGERRDACRVLIVKPERKRPRGKHRRRFEDNIKTDFIKCREQ
jgi:hypothetical protein